MDPATNATPWRAEGRDDEPTDLRDPRRVRPRPGAKPASSDEAKYKLKPGAKGKSCLGCHADFAETLKQPFVHTPVKAGDCSDCHSPHASDHGKLLAEDANKVCVSCHADVVPAKAKSAHPDVMSGNCVKCHDPHATKNKAQLLKAGNELCASCHPQLGKAVLEAKFKHSPVGQSCLGCHDPHATAETPHLLAKTAPALCVGCHKPDTPGFQKAHLNYPVAKADCSSCHDPHGSSQPAILWATVHPPVKTRMCAQCHNEAGSPEALQTRRQGVDGCKACHAEAVNTALNNSRLHWPVVDKVACLNCHNPHATKAPKLLADDEKDLCGRCHADAVARQERSVTKHQPILDGACSTCHAPHGSNVMYILNGGSIEGTCGPCHDWGKHSAHPSGDKVFDPRNKNLSLDCLSCHRTHGTGFKHMAHFDTKRDLCVQCHSGMAR